MIKRKKILLIIAILVLIALTGVFFLHGKNIKPDVQASLSLLPETIPAAKAGLSVKRDFDKIDKGLLILQYKNNTPREIKNVQILIDSSTSEFFGIIGSKNATIDRDSDHGNTPKNIVIFNAPDLKANTNHESTFFVFTTKPGDITLKAEVKADNNLAETNSVVLKVR